ncbi:MULTISPECIES: hypothetical protein [unclassified Mycobacterium]|uniref:hypothetical protein n=1 Tax=unclassified Mycobacterium TaxID=2642494 RepID=UPI0029C64103|nr:MULTISPECIES: hypothetical protein [unclassified Mycobacterium]
MSDPVDVFVADLLALGAAPERRGPLIVYTVDVISGPHSGAMMGTGVEVAELVGWPIAPPHWIHLPAAVVFEHTNSQPSPVDGWIRHSRQINDWGSDPDPGQAWVAHVRGVLGDAR